MSSAISKHSVKKLLQIVIYFILLNKYNVMPQKHGPNSVRINKCCERFEILVDFSCTQVNESVTSEYTFFFTYFDHVKKYLTTKTALLLMHCIVKSKPVKTI